MSIDKSSRNWKLSQMTNIQACNRPKDRALVMIGVLPSWLEGGQHDFHCGGSLEGRSVPLADAAQLGRATGISSCWNIVFVLKTPSSPMRPKTWELIRIGVMPPELKKLQQKVYELYCKEACSAGAAQLRVYGNSCSWYIQYEMYSTYGHHQCHEWQAAHNSKRPKPYLCSSVMSRMAWWASTLGYPCPLCGHNVFIVKLDQSGYI